MTSSKTEILLVFQRGTNEVPDYPVGLQRQQEQQTAAATFGEQLAAGSLNQLPRNRSHPRSMPDKEKLEELITTLREDTPSSRFREATAVSGQPSHRLALAAFSDEQGDD